MAPDPLGAKTGPIANVTQGIFRKIIYDLCDARWKELVLWLPMHALAT